MRTLQVRSLDQYTPAPVRWLWPQRIPRGKVTLLAGDPGLGKSFITMDIAARVSRGMDWPDADAVKSTPGRVLVLSAEDDPADTLRPRLEKCGGDPSRVVFVESAGKDGPSGGQSDSVNLTRDIPAIEDALKLMGNCRLVIVDPISAYMGEADSNNNAEVRAVLKDLSRLAMEYGPAVVCVTHLSKGSQGGKAVYRAMGSLAFTAAARVVWQVSKLPGESSLRAMTLVKSNLPVTNKGMTYRIDEEGFVQWLSSDFEMPADEVEGTPEEGSIGESLSESMEFLKSALAEGPREAGELLEAAKRVGLSEKTLKRAKRAVGVVSTRAAEGGRDRAWVWALPAANGSTTPSSGGAQ